MLRRKKACAANGAPAAYSHVSTLMPGAKPAVTAASASSAVVASRLSRTCRTARKGGVSEKEGTDLASRGFKRSAPHEK